LGIELLERAADAGAKILKVEQLTGSGDAANPQRGAGYLLTFDVGRILVAADPANDRLAVKEIPVQAELQGERIALGEEEPWWRVTGCSITRIWPGPSGEGATSASEEPDHLRLQFREDTDNPRVISLRFDAGEVAVALEPTDVG